ITQLSRHHELAVRSLGTVRRYAGAEQDVQRAGRELQVDAVLEGSVQQSQGAIHVNVRLLHVETGRALSAASFNEQLRDLLGLQDAIADRVAEALPAELKRDERKLALRHETTDPEAYRYFLEGRFFFGRRTLEGFQRAVERFELAIRRDPQYAAAHAALAEA